MSTITAILEADADGTLHLPLPADAPRGKLKVTATLEPADAAPAQPRATPEAIKQRLEAFARLRALNPFRDIKDPVAWEREMREDVKLPGRD
ncbi:hypothetical protein BH20VER1_BH20VER1_12460 [soil metagenome]